MSTKKYYWLKLQKDFFKRHDIKIIEAMPNGKDYVLFYLKLLVESLNHNGALRFSDTIPYNEQMLATITNTNIDIVRAAMKLFAQLEMIEVLDDQTIYMREVQRMVGCETQWAEKKRLQRVRKEDNVLPVSSSCPPGVRQEIEIEKELDIEKDNTEEKPHTPYQEIANLFSSICQSYPQVKKLSDARKKAIKARMADGYILDDFQTLFTKAEASDFLKGLVKSKGHENWKATFDWLITDRNMPRVIEGVFDNKEKQSSGSLNMELIENEGLYDVPKL